MSLVTRCASCGTVFRVVQDQLKVSSGWVRCGRCGEVFNALQTLFDLERDVVTPPAQGQLGSTPTPDHRMLRDAAPGPGPTQVSAARPMAPPPAAPVEPWRADARGFDASPPAPRAAPLAPTTRPGSGGPADSFAASAPSPNDFTASVLPDDVDTGAPTGGNDGRSVWPSDSMPSRWIEPNDESAHPAGAASDSRQLMLVGADADSSSAAADAPEFLREDRRRARWSSPVARGLLGSAALGLLMLLLAQVALHERDKVADLWPWSRPLLAQACRIGGCEVLEAPRRIDSFTVESTALTKVGSSTDTYRLTITLRNRGARAAMLPSVELSLLDGEGQLLSRRALSPGDFRVQRPVVPSGADTTLQLVLSAGRGRVNGFTIEIFYP
jgi:predicted Zn finger-like uncharacterized protein